jgi:hypothetical protein
MTCGKSDASYHKRLYFQRLAAAGFSADSILVDGGTNALSAKSTLEDGGANAGLKLLPGRERLLQDAGGSAAAPRQSSAMMLAIQQATEWLIPASHLPPIDETVSGDAREVVS